jgi:threonine dehydratase
MFPLAQQHLHRMILVEDDDIRRAQKLLWDAFRLVVEPGGATALAALLAGHYRPSQDEHVVAVLCGANTER